MMLHNLTRKLSGLDRLKQQISDRMGEPIVPPAMLAACELDVATIAGSPALANLIRRTADTPTNVVLNALAYCAALPHGFEDYCRAASGAARGVTKID